MALTLAKLEETPLSTVLACTSTLAHESLTDTSLALLEQAITTQTAIGPYLVGITQKYTPTIQK